MTTKNATIKQAWFAKEETISIAMSALALSLALTGGQWGEDTFSASEGLKNIFIAFPVVLFSFVAHEFAHKLAARRNGVHAVFKPAWPMVAFSAVIGIISGGWVVITAVGTWVLTSLKRIGFKYPFVGAPAQAKIALMGPMVSLLLAIFAKVFIGIFGESRLLQDLFTFNLWMVFFNMIPFLNFAQRVAPGMRETSAKQIFPSFDGEFVFAGNPVYYVSFMGFAIVAVLCLLFLPVWVSAIVGVIAGILAWTAMQREGMVEILKR